MLTWVTVVTITNNQEDRIAETLAYGEELFYGESEQALIDRIAVEGITFTDAHSNSSVCTPTRYGILTGRYAWRTELKSRVLNGHSPALIKKDRLTVGGFLQDQGYKTACIGKWHLGHSRQYYHPLARGYTYFYGHLSGAIDYFD